MQQDVCGWGRGPGSSADQSRCLYLQLVDTPASIKCPCIAASGFLTPSPLTTPGPCNDFPQRAQEVSRTSYL